MNRFLLALLPILASLGACSSTQADYGPLSGDARVVGKVSKVELKDGRVRFDDSGLAVYQVILVNKDDDARWIEWRAQWYDLEGFQINDPARAWLRVNMQPESQVPLKSIAPSALASDCIIEIREPKEGIR